MNGLEKMVLKVRLAIRARRAKMSPGPGIIGLSGIAQTPIDPEGTVFVRGELWLARSTGAIAAGGPVRIAGMNGVTLDVDSDQQQVAQRDPGKTADKRP